MSAARPGVKRCAGWGHGLLLRFPPGVRLKGPFFLTQALLPLICDGGRIEVSGGIHL